VGLEGWQPQLIYWSCRMTELLDRIPTLKLDRSETIPCGSGSFSGHAQHGKGRYAIRAYRSQDRGINSSDKNADKGDYCAGIGQTMSRVSHQAATENITSIDPDVLKKAATGSHCVLTFRSWKPTEDEFAQIVRLAPLVSIELIIRDNEQTFLWHCEPSLKQAFLPSLF
jgi:hypothetical protein